MNLNTLEKYIFKYQQEIIHYFNLKKTFHPNCLILKMPIDMENDFNQVLNENDINNQRKLLIEWLHNYIDKQNWKRCTDSIAQKRHRASKKNGGLQSS